MSWLRLCARRPDYSFLAQALYRPNLSVDYLHLVTSLQTAFNHVWCVARQRDVGALASFTSSGVVRNSATAFNHVWCVARLRDVGALASFTSSGVARNSASAFNYVWCVVRLRDIGALASFTSSGVVRRLQRMKDFVSTP